MVTGIKKIGERIDLTVKEEYTESTECDTEEQESEIKLVGAMFITDEKRKEQNSQKTLI